MLVVEAREIGRGRLLTVEPDVLDRDRAGPGAISPVLIRSCDTVIEMSAPQVAEALGQQI